MFPIRRANSNLRLTFNSSINECVHLSARVQFCASVLYPSFILFEVTDRYPNTLTFIWLQIWVYGNSFESFLVAVVVPDRKALEDWATEHNLTDDYKSLCQNLKARKYICDELNSTGQKQQGLSC
ncbi:PREDICTED: long chain acyl-CoA synthetase 2-like [Fragaria vesca subsp. vesca]